MRRLQPEETKAIDVAIRRAHQLVADRNERVTEYAIFRCARELLEETDAGPRASVALADAVALYWRNRSR